MKRVFTFTILFIVIILFGIGIYNIKAEFTMERPVPEQTQEQEARNEELERIRNREDVKKQQELLVQEVYLLERKKEAVNKKEEALRLYEEEVSQIETELESVRAQKLSF